MLEKSVGECYFVTLMVADAPQAADLDDDVEFFDSRLSYLSVTRHGHAKTAPVRASTNPSNPQRPHRGHIGCTSQRTLLFRAGQSLGFAKP